VYATRGVKVIGAVAGSARGRVNAVAGLCEGRLLGAQTYQCSMDADIFYFWVKTYLLPEMHSGQVLIIDNASFHKEKRLRQLLNRHGIGCWYLPPYSPDFNPIENYWAWSKGQLRLERRGDPRTFADLDTSIKDIFKRPYLQNYS
jgi:transposase